MVMLVFELTSKVLNAIPQYEGQEPTIKAITCYKAMLRMAEALDYSCDWLDWNSRAKDDRRGLLDYYRETDMRRGTCLLRPIPR
jgi:hypothetical protein